MNRSKLLDHVDRLGISGDVVRLLLTLLVCLLLWLVGIKLDAGIRATERNGRVLCAAVANMDVDAPDCDRP